AGLGRADRPGRGRDAGDDRRDRAGPPPRPRRRAARRGEHVSALPGRLRAGWMAVTGTGAAAGVSLAVLVLVSVFVAVAGARVSQTVPTSALRAGLRMLPTSDKAVLGSAGYDDSGMGEVGPLPAAQLASSRKQLRGTLSRRLPLAPAATDWTGLTTGYSTVLAGGRRAWDGSTPPQLELAYRDALPHYTKHITGSP